MARTEPELAAFLDALAERRPDGWIPRYLFGVLHHFRGDVPAAEAAYEQAATLARARDDRRGEAESTYARATLVLRTNEPERGLALLERAIDLARAADDPILIGRVLRTAADQYRDRARYFDEHALRVELLALARDGAIEQSVDRAQFLLAENLRRLGHHREARAGFERAKELARESGNARYEANSAMALGVLLLDAGEDGALELFEAAAAIAEGDPRLGSRAVFAQILAGLALLRAEQFEAARERLAASLESSRASERLHFRNLVYLAEAERLTGRDEDAEGRYRQLLELAEHEGVQESLRDALMGLAALHLRRGRTAEAIAAADRAVSLVESMRTNIGPFTERTHFLQARSNTYQLLAAALAERDGRDLGRAFDVMERAHARTLLEVLQASGGTDRPIPRIDLAEVQAALGPGDLMIEFLLGEESSSLLAVGPEGATLHALSASRVLDRRVGDYLDVLRRPLTSLDARVTPEADFRRFADAGHVLFRELLEPVADRIASAERLIVVPDRRLHLLPFEALVTRPVVAARPVEFLGAALPIEYLPAAAFLAGERPTAVEGRVLVVVAGRGRADLGLAPLTHVEEEARAVADSYPRGGATVLRGDAATVEAVVAQLAQPTDVLHLSAHALLDSELGPRVALAAGTIGGDGLLDAVTISELAGAPRLAVLSACDTARGELVGGEGVLGLVRAFTLAGSSQIVATLWTVDDERSAELMGRFHAELQRGLPTSRALWQARRAMLDRGFVHPFAWSGFVLYGAD